MAIKLEKVKAGDVLLDVHRHKMGNTTMSELGLWYVKVIGVDLEGGRALVSWNNNRREWWPRARVQKLYTTPPKAYRDQQERAAQRAAVMRRVRR